MNLIRHFTHPLIVTTLVGGISLVSLSADTPSPNTPEASEGTTRIPSLKGSQTPQKAKKVKKPQSPKDTADEKAGNSEETSTTEDASADNPTDAESDEETTTTAGGSGGGTGAVPNTPTRPAGKSGGTETSGADYGSPWLGGGAPSGGAGTNGSDRAKFRSTIAPASHSSTQRIQTTSAASNISGGPSVEVDPNLATLTITKVNARETYAFTPIVPGPPPICACFTTGIGSTPIWQNTAPTKVMELQPSSHPALTGGSLNLSGNAIAYIPVESVISISLTGIGGLTKTGWGGLTINKVNTYTGVTQVNEGNLILENGGTISGPVSVNSGTTLNIKFSGVVLSPVSINNGATLNMESGGVISSSVSINSGGHLEGTGTIGGVLTLNGGDLSPSAPRIDYYDFYSRHQFGTFHTGSLVSNSGTIFFDLSSPYLGSYDQLDVADAVNLLGASANFSLLNSYLYIGSNEASRPYFLINNDGTDPILGTFSNVAEGAVINLRGIDFLATYQADSTTNSMTGGNDFALGRMSTVAPSIAPHPVSVPEPPNALWIGLAALALGRRRGALGG